MAKITWVLKNGRRIEADVAEGRTLMEAAQALMVPNILGECGGNLSCATCHVYVDEAWADRVGPPGAFEDEMLDAAEAERRPTSRLSCQITASEALDGLVLHVPEPD